MKKLYSILSLFVSVLAFTACTPEVDNNFSDTPTDRVETTIKNTREILKAAPNGWRMEYYASTTYGGYNVFAKFDDVNVTVASELVGSSHKGGFGEDGMLNRETSHYKLEASQGVVLSFDEHNEIFHYFSDPANEDYGSKGEGMEGDFEFRVMSASAEKIELVGKKHEAKIVMYPVKEGTTWEDYVNEVIATRDFMASRSYEFEVEGSDRVVPVVTSYRRLIFEDIDEKGQTLRHAAAFIITPEGYKLYRPTTVNGVEISMILKGETEEFFVVENTPTARFYTYVPPLAELFKTGTWFITYEDLGEYAKTYWNSLLKGLGTAGPNNTRNRLYWALLGTYLSRTAFHMQAGGDYCYEGMKVEQLNEEGTEVKLSWDPTVRNAAAKTYYNRYGLKDAIYPFYGSGRNPREFTLSTDNQRHPTYLILTDKNEPTNVIKLWSEEKNYPFGDLDADEK